MVFCGRAKALAAPKPAAPSFPWCCWRCRCIRIQASTTAWRRRPIASCSSSFQVEHWAVLVITPHNRLKLGPTKALQVFLEQQVVWFSLEELSQQPNLDPLLNLLTLPVRPESELAASSQQILASRPDLKTVVLPMLVQRFPDLTTTVSSRTSKSW